MNEENIRKAAERAKLSEKDTEVFVKFFSKRFPDESDKIESYVNEWANRFKSGEPKVYMDSWSLAIYNEVNK